VLPIPFWILNGRSKQNGTFVAASNVTLADLLLDIKIEVEGFENIKFPSVVVLNHQSLLDFIGDNLISN
jgi:1-acyl-sn-glycerol-3-phosphate acyltransferase